MIDLSRGKIDRDETKRRLRKALDESAYEDVVIGQMYASLLLRRRDLDEARELQESMSKHHSADQLRFVEMQVAMLSGEYQHALDAAEKWLEVEPFNANAASHVTYLLSEYAREYDKAIQVGERFRQRVQDRNIVANNVAYSMVMAGRLSEAEQLLASAEKSPCVVATLGLLDIRRGELQRGREAYDKAISMAMGSRDPELALLLKVRRSQALMAAGDSSSEVDAAEFTDLEDDPRFWLISR
jgi:tetratricopeptide (TPR) repeat protein